MWTRWTMLSSFGFCWWQWPSAHVTYSSCLYVYMPPLSLAHSPLPSSAFPSLSIYNSYVLFHTVCATDGFVYVVCVQLCIFNAQSGKRVIYIHTRACRQNVSSSTHTFTLTCTCTYRLLLCFCILTEIRWTVNSEHHKISPPDLKYSASLVEFIMHIEYAMAPSTITLATHVCITTIIKRTNAFNYEWPKRATSWLMPLFSLRFSFGLFCLVRQQSNTMVCKHCSNENGWGVRVNSTRI